jgi:hypothetical protein
LLFPPHGTARKKGENAGIIAIDLATEPAMKDWSAGQLVPITQEM